MNNNNKLDLFFFSRISTLVPKGIYKVLFFAHRNKKLKTLCNSIFDNEIHFFINFKYLPFYLNFFKKYTKLQAKILTDLTAVDFLNKSYRFLLVYNLLSIVYNFRVFLNVEIKEFSIINSSFNIYKASVWLEREIWDFFGIFFSNHPDLRRILTDYGFIGFPLRKDFPLMGFIEVRYDEEKKAISYDNVEFSQIFRHFKFNVNFDQILNKTYIKNKYSENYLFYFNNYYMFE